MFAAQTVSRLQAVLTGMVSSAAMTLFGAGFIGRGTAVGGATLAVMGMMLGAAGGIPAGLWLERRGLQPADRCLPFLVGLICLPLALLPLDAEARLSGPLALGGWASVLAGSLAALPLGGCMGASWAIWSRAGRLDLRGNLGWTGLGIGLGVAAALGPLLGLSELKGAALVELFAAPLLWPILPRSGERSLLARMLLTLGVVVATMILLFL